MPAGGLGEADIGGVRHQLPDMVGDCDGHQHIGRARDVHHRNPHIGEVDELVRALNFAVRQFVSLNQPLVDLQRGAPGLGEHAVHQPADRLDLSQELPVVTVLEQRDGLLQVDRQ